MPYCTSCGLAIPPGQGSSCSMCYGDPNWGNDGYYLDYLRFQEEYYFAQQQEAEAQQREEEDVNG